MGEADNVISLRSGDRAFHGVVNETGQAVTGFIPSPKGRKRKARQKMMSMVDVMSMSRLQLSMVEARVFWQIMAHVPPRTGSVSYCTVTQLADELGMHVSDVSKTMKALRERYIIRTVRQGQHHVNTWLVFSGSFDEWNATDDTETEPIWHRHGVDPATGEVL